MDNIIIEKLLLRSIFLNKEMAKNSNNNFLTWDKLYRRKKRVWDLLTYLILKK